MRAPGVTATRAAVIARRPQTAAVALLAASLALYGSVWAFVEHEPFHVGAPKPNSFDLKVYRTAASAVLHGRRLYQMRLFAGMRFTYPPFAAPLLTPNRLLAEPADAAVVAMLNVVMLIAIVRLTPRVGADASTEDGRAPSWSWSRVAVVSAFVLWLEPVTMAIGYGQIDLAITLLIVADLARPRSARGRGVGIGLAAGLKLTPLLFVPYLLLGRDRRTAFTAVGAFLATIAVGFLALPADSVRFWTGTFLQSSRAGNVAAPVNQSLFGLIARAERTTQLGIGSTLVVAVAGVAGVLLAARAARRGEDGVGFAVCALTSLLVSPISWSHHWVLALPAVTLLLMWAWRRRLWSVLAVAGCLCLTAALYVPERFNVHGKLAGHAFALVTDPYVVLGVIAVLVTGVAGERRRADRALRAARPGRRGVGQPSMRSGQV